MKKFELFVGSRYFRSKKSNKFISFITGLSVIGITIGVMVIITVLSVMNGFQNTVRDKIINTGFHIYLTSYGKTSLVYDYQDKINQIKKNESVQVASPFFKGQVIIRSTIQRIMGIDLHGIEKSLPEKDKSFSRTVEIVKGKFDLNDEKNILLGQELADFLDVDVNDRVDIISPQGGKIEYAGRIAPIMKKYKVVGIFKTGYYDYDLKLAFVSLKSMQELVNKPYAAWGIGIKIDNIYDAPKIAKKIKKLFHNRYFTITWMRFNYNLFTALKTEKTIMAVIVFLIIIVAAFCIISNLVMIVMEKKKDIAILKTFGATSNQITAIFLFTGVTIGATGIVFGVITGLLASYNFEKILRFIEKIVNKVVGVFHAIGNVFVYIPLPEKFELLPANVYYLDKFPVEVFFQDVLSVCIGALIVVILSSYLPARQAAKFKPMEIIRYE